MMFKVVGADGREATEEMETLYAASEMIGMSPESVQRARQRYFSDKSG
jgi:uncharacterized tellurite resistance protein B-like protein